MHKHIAACGKIAAIKNFYARMDRPNLTIQI